MTIHNPLEILDKQETDKPTNGHYNPASPQLLPHHYTMLSVESGIDDKVIKARGYFSVTTSEQVRALGFSLQQSYTVSKQHPALVIPYHNPDGSLQTYCLRPDSPRSLDNKKKSKLSDGTYPQKVFKYEMMKGAGNVLDTNPIVTQLLNNPKTPLFFTEGAKKADSLISKGYCAINLNGVWGWRGTNKEQGKTALSGFNDIALNDRHVYLVFDSDIRTNSNVKGAIRRFKAYLKSKKALCHVVMLPPLQGEKTGIDDFFTLDHSKADFEALLSYWAIFEADISEEKPDKVTTDFITAWYQDNGYNFAINDMNDLLLMNDKELDNNRLIAMRTEFRDAGLPIAHVEETRVKMGLDNKFHPIRDYFDSLPKWDGKTDYIALLASFLPDEKEVLYTWLRRWLVGAVAKIYTEAESQNFMLVLDGPQGCGKSSFVKWLCPKTELFTESKFNPDNKDSELKMADYFIWELGELEYVTTRADRGMLKGLITKEKISVRRSYDRLDTKKPVTVSFIGTVNGDGVGFLNDPTGNRRYAVATLESIDFGYTEIDVNLVWSQAYGLYLSGETWLLKDTEAELRDEINSYYEIEDPLEGRILDEFIIDTSKADNEAWHMRAADILDDLGLKSDNKLSSMRISQILNNQGIGKKKFSRKDKKGYYWLGIKRMTQADKDADSIGNNTVLADDFMGEDKPF